MKDQIAVFNPLRKDFEYEWFNDKNEKVVLSIPARDLKYFPPSQGNFIAKHLADEIINERGEKPNAEEAYRLAMKEILVKP